MGAPGRLACALCCCIMSLTMRVDLPQTGYLGELEYNKVTASVWRPVNDSWSRVLSGNRLARGSAPPVYGMQLWFSLRGMGAGVTQPPSRKLKRKQALVCGFSGATNRAGVCVSRTLRECGRRCGQSAEGWEGLGQKGGIQEPMCAVHCNGRKKKASY